MYLTGQTLNRRESGQTQLRELFLLSQLTYLNDDVAMVRHGLSPTNLHSGRVAMDTPLCDMSAHAIHQKSVFNTNKFGMRVCPDSIRDWVWPVRLWSWHVIHTAADCGGDNNCLDAVQNLSNCASITVSIVMHGTLQGKRIDSTCSQAANPTTALCPGMHCRTVYDSVLKCHGDPDVPESSVDTVRQALDAFNQTSKSAAINYDYVIVIQTAVQVDCGIITTSKPHYLNTPIHADLSLHRCSLLFHLYSPDL